MSDNIAAPRTVFEAFGHYKDCAKWKDTGESFRLQHEAACTCAEVQRGWLCLESWAGHTQTLVAIVGETPKRYRIRALTLTKLAGRARWLSAGETALVPKYAVRATAEKE